MSPRLGVAASATLAIATVCVLIGARLLTSAAPSSGQPGSNSNTASTLPAGVCPFSITGLPVTQATRMQAKLVGFDTALASDPNFPFKGSTISTGSRSQPPIRIANYFWVVAAAGNFHLNFPRPPGTGPEVASFSYVLFYIPADRCNMDGGYVTQGLGAWPAWFDSMQALSATTIK